MKFLINHNLLTQVYNALAERHNLYWIVGGSGAGKTTVSKILSERFGLQVYDMDAHIYGIYHVRFTKDRHPVNYAWKTARNGLEWLLSMSWQEFKSFNQAALPEYLDLFAEDILLKDANMPVLIDGGICNPGLLSQVLPAHHIVCLSRPQHTSEFIWKENKERQGMKELVYKLPKPEKAWQTFLAFDKQITQNTLRECRNSNIPVCTMEPNESANAFAYKVARVLGIQDLDIRKDSTEVKK